MERGRSPTKEMLSYYMELAKKKKEIEAELDKMKKEFSRFFDEQVGKNEKGEIIVENYKLQRQIRKIEKYDRKKTVARLEQLNLADLIEKRPDEGKIKSAIQLGLLSEEELAGCKQVAVSEAIYVKPVK